MILQKTFERICIPRIRAAVFCLMEHGEGIRGLISIYNICQHPCILMGECGGRRGEGRVIYTSMQYYNSLVKCLKNTPTDASKYVSTLYTKPLNILLT